MRDIALANALGSLTMLAGVNREGWVSGARRVASPNCDARPPGCEPEALIVHCISLPPGVYGGDEVEAFFCNRLDPASHPYFEEIGDLKVSAHFFIRRDGELIQFVPAILRAWHAGESRCLGRGCVNDFSLGVELEGLDDAEFTDDQYRRLIELSRILMNAFPEITPERVFGHSDIAPGRKTDPGPGFDWAKYRGALRADG